MPQRRSAPINNRGIALPSRSTTQKSIGAARIRRRYAGPAPDPREAIRAPRLSRAHPGPLGIPPVRPQGAHATSARA